MLRIDLPTGRMDRLSEEALQSAKIRERNDLQELIVKNPEAFCKEIDEELFIIGSEIAPSDTVADRIDLLAVDSVGDIVIIELKRHHNKLHLLQAIPYAAMIARWQPEQFLKEVASEERRKAYGDFLDEYELTAEEINQAQRIILIAEDYDWEVLIAAEWLSGNFEVGIRCMRLSMAVDKTNNARYLSFAQLYPQPELEDYARSRGSQRTENVQGRPQDWNALLDTYKNPDLVSFVKNWLTTGDRAMFKPLLRSHRLVFPNHPEKWRVNLARNHAQVMQSGRFKLADGQTDENYWKKGLSDPQSVAVRRDGIRLHFTLTSKGDFDFFGKAVTGALKDIQLKDAVPG